MELKILRKNVRTKKKAMAVFLSSVFALNTSAMIGIKTHGSVPSDSKAVRNDIIESAAAYLKSRENSDKSFGSNQLINDTIDALIALRVAGEQTNENNVKWAESKISLKNVDMVSRLASASGKSEYLGNLKGFQNQDGGFGLYPDYSSDILDSVLVLEAINETGYNGSDISGSQICSYLISNVKEDGGYSYTEASGSDEILTSMVVYNVGRFLSTNNYDMTSIEKSVSYIEEKITDSYSDSDIEKTVYKYLALQAVGSDFDTFKVVNDLDKAEKKNGSFAESVHVTSLVIRLLDKIDLENKISITAFDTELSDNEASAEKSGTITASTSIGYVSNYDAELDLKFTVFNGENSVYENTCKVNCPESEKTAEVQSADFKLSEPSDEGIYVLVELYNGNNLLKTQRINISLPEGKDEYSTEITDLSVDLDTHAAVKSDETDVAVSYALLYATNIERNVKMKTVVSKGGKTVKTAVEDAVLVPEKNTITGQPLSFTPDTSTAGTYDVTVICLYEGEEVCRRSARFDVIDPPAIDEKQDENEETQFEITWFGPILSDYYLYAGNETEVSAGAEINYFSNGTVNGKVEMAVYNGEELIVENTFDVALEKGVVTYFDEKANYPVYKSESQLTFNVKNVGEYDVYAKLYDQNGELLKEGKRTLKVVDKPVQDLILNSSVNDEKDDMIDLSWNDISNDAESYSYQLYRKTNHESWEPRSIWNEEEHINVLNVYPAGAYLAEWMNNTISDTETPAGKGIFDIDSVHIATFNSDPAKYMLKEDGSWKYDVIFFGSSDCNSGYDMSSSAAVEIQKFIDSGRGVLFGHDTMNRYLGHVNFNSFDEQTGLHVSNGFGNFRTTSVSVVKLGTLTNYPWTIRGDLTVPNTHTSGQFITDGTEWITLNTRKDIDPESGGIDGFYLCTKNNLGMIQTGDSTGQASDDERKILANTLFYLYQISQQTTAKDASFYDVDAPDTPELISSSNKDGKLELSVSSVDNATEYEYYISANPSDSKSDSVLSNVRKHTALSGLAGFVVKVNGSDEPSPELIEYDETREFILDVVPAGADGKAVLSAEPEDLTQPQYVHIFAVDKANNVSEEYIVPFADTQLITNIDTDKKLYSYGDSVEIDTDTLSAPFGRTADMTIDIYDEFDNKTAEIASSPEQVLTADTKFLSSAEWQVPQDTVGRYKAVISWQKDDKVIASAETGFKIANEKSISNVINSDKRSYSLTEPINLASVVYNNSAAMTENDLILNVKVFDSNGREKASFEHNVGSVNPDGSMDYSDALSSGTLKDGDYKVTAAVVQDGMELSTDTAEFTVEGDVTSFSGKLDLTPEKDKSKVEFSVTNSGSADADEVLVKVDVYKDGTTELVYTYSKTVPIKAGDTFTDSASFDIPAEYSGTFSGVLSAEYKNTPADLDYDGFDVAAEPTTGPAAEESASETETTAATTTAVKTTIENTDSPKTGDNEIPAYMWAISILSIAGLVLLKKTGGGENENE